MKTLLKVIGVIVVVLALAAGGGWWYVSNNLFSFEDGNGELPELETLTIDGYTFLDRNANGELDVYEDDRESLEARVADVLAQMSQEEKIHLLKGSGIASAVGMGETAIPGAVGTVVSTPRLGIPTIYLSDGPAGLRIEPKREGEDRTYYCTAFPIATLLASSWDTDLIYEVGNAMGTEAREYGIDVILGPGANLHRHPLCGRNFEYYSEDPVLTGKMGAAIINGIESQGVGTSVKHYVANNQETDRVYNDAIVSERALREIYLRGFEIIVKEAQPWTIMSSYNRVNGTYVSESKKLLTEVLRDDWNFQGVVMTDWFGGDDAVAQVSAGNDLLEPGTNNQWKALKAGADNGTLTEATIDAAASRILGMIFQSRKMQNYQYGNNPDLEAHAAITRQSATEGMVLLKNQNQALPISAGTNVALLGATSYDFIAGGTGSGDVNEAYTVSLEEGLVDAGFVINEKSKAVFTAHKSQNKEAFIKEEGLAGMLNPYAPPRMAYTSMELADIVATADVGIITIGRNSGEFTDRLEKDDFLLYEKERNMITAVCDAFHAVNKQVIVVLNIGGVIETASWKDQPDAILLAWQGGQEGGNSVADLISGQANPSGKLPMTFPVQLSDHRSNANFPLTGSDVSILKMITGDRAEKPEAEKVKNKDYTIYEEGIYVGYRHFDKEALPVSYPFGYGLSYASFAFNDLGVEVIGDTIEVAMSITNTGEVAGKEVAQVYLAKPDTQIDRPVKEIKAFAKTIHLAPGLSDTLRLQVPVAELRYWSEDINNWVLESGSYEVQVGASSRDIRLTQMIELD